MSDDPVIRISVPPRAEDQLKRSKPLALGRGLLLASDAVWFISRGVVESEVEAGVLVPIALGATFLSGAVGMTTVVGQDVPGAVATLTNAGRNKRSPIIYPL